MRGWVVGVLLGMIAQSPALADTRVALVIGNSKYSAVGPLPNPDKDAALVATSLQAEGFKVTLVQDANREAMLGALNGFSDASADADWALVYYAGHGIEIGGVNYLLPTDAKLRTDRDAQDEGVSLNRVLDSVESAHKLRIVILDACRNNPFATAMKRSGKQRAVERGLASVEPQSGTLVVYAAAAGQVAEDGTGDHSPFTTALVKRIQEPGLEVSRLFNVVAADVLKATARHQLPFQYGSNPTLEEFFFTPPTHASVAPGAVSSFAETWEFLKASNDAPTLSAFFAKLPANDPLHAEVEARLEAVRAAKPPAEKVAVLPVAPPKAIVPRSLTPTECDRLAASPFDADLPKGFPSIEPDRIDAEAAIPACQAAVQAAPDDRRLHFQLGRALQFGKRDDEAKQEYERAVTAGSAVAMNNLGNLYHEGRGVARDFDTARRMYEASASTGNVTAIANLGNINRRGDGVPKNLDAARAYFERAAAGGNPVAMLNLGSMYRSGEGVPKNLDTARAYFERAATAGNTAALYALASLYQRGDGVPKNLDTARSLYEKAATAGNVTAMSELGRLYMSNDSGRPNYENARSWLEKAAGSNNTPAMNNLGVIYQNGLGVPRNLDTARTWYEKAAAAGQPHAMNNLARMYENGEGAPRNFETARGWYEKAALAGNVTAIYNLGVVYARGEGVPQNLDTARAWYEKSAIGGNANAMSALGVFYENGEGVARNFETARGWYEKAAAGGNLHAMASLGRFFEFGLGEPKNLAMAHAWYEKAAAAGSNYARGALTRFGPPRR